MFKPLAIRPGIQCQMTKHCQFLSQAKAYNFHLKHSEFVTSRFHGILQCLRLRNELGIHVQTFSHKARNPVSNDKTLPIFITG